MKKITIILLTVFLLAASGRPFALAAEGGDHHEDHGQEGHDSHDHEAQQEPAADEHGHEEGLLELSEEQQRAIGLQTMPAAAGSLHSEITVTGEVVLNEDAVVHIVPRVSGIALSVSHTIGDGVRKGEVLAVLESAELGQVFSEYMVSRNGYERKRQLYQEQIASQNDYLEALNRFEQTAAALYIKLGKERYLKAVARYEERYPPKAGEQPASHDAGSLSFLQEMTRYEITSPIEGKIIEKHLTRGERVTEETDVFTVADLATVWVQLKIPVQDIPAVRPGMTAVIEAQNGFRSEGRIDLVSPLVNEETRTAMVRVVMANPDGTWRPGSFVTGHILVSAKDLALVVPLAAVQLYEGREGVFLAEEHGFEFVPVITGRRDRTRVEITSGLKPGQEYVVAGAFELKAILMTSGMDSHAGHGH